VTETDVLVDQRVLGLTAIRRGAVDETGKGRAELEVTADAVVEVALVDSLLEYVGSVDESRPAVEEVTVETVAGGVSVGPDPGRGPSGVEGELLDLEDELVEELDDLDGVAGRTVTTAVVVTVGRPGHVRPVIGRVQVLAVPAGGEVDLGTHTVRAVVGEEVVALRPCRITLVAVAVVETDVADGLVVHVGLVEDPTRRVPRDHAETIREGVDGVVLAVPVEVVLPVSIVIAYK
jgi:hypothetical protein